MKLTSGVGANLFKMSLNIIVKVTQSNNVVTEETYSEIGCIVTLGSFYFAPGATPPTRVTIASGI